MRFLNHIKSIRPVGGFRVRAVFQDGFIGEVDLAPLVNRARGPLLEALRDPDLFERAFVDEGSAAWPNGYDICPDVLRYYCELGRVCSDEEMNAAFNEPLETPETSASYLKDEPPK